MALNRMRPVYPKCDEVVTSMRTIATGVTIPCTACTVDVGVAWVCLPYYSIWYKKITVDFCWVHSQFLGGDRVLDPAQSQL